MVKEVINFILKRESFCSDCNCKEESKECPSILFIKITEELKYSPNENDFSYEKFDDDIHKTLENNFESFESRISSIR